MKNITYGRKLRRKLRVSKKIRGTALCPRISIYRSSKFIYAQVIDDTQRKTICSFNSKQIKPSGKITKSQAAKEVGLKLAALLKEKQIKKGVFDRSVYTYLGRVKQLASGLREGGLII